MDSVLPAHTSPPRNNQVAKIKGEGIFLVFDDVGQTFFTVL